MNQPNPSANGFTIAELVSTILIVGILAAVAIPRFIGKSAFASRGFYDEAQTVVRYAQKIAIAQRRLIYVCITPTTITAAQNSGCPTPLVHPGTGAALTSTAPSGVTLAPVTQFTFDGIGRPSTALTITFTSTIPDDPARQMIVEAEVGYVHP